MTREDIVEAAFRVWGGAMFTKMSLSGVSAALGVTKPALYRHFRSKDDLLQAMALSHVDKLAGFLASRLKNRESTGGGKKETASAPPLFELSMSIGEFFAENASEFLFVLSRLFGARSSELKLAEHLGRHGVNIEDIYPPGDEGALQTHLAVSIVFYMMLFKMREDFLRRPDSALWVELPQESASEKSVFLSELRVRLEGGVGFIKERVFALDYETLYNAVSLTEGEPSIESESAVAHILKTVGEVIAETGPFEASVDMFAKRSGLSKSSLYGHFASRAEMISAFFAKEFGKVIEVAQRNAAKAAEPEAQLFMSLAACALYLRNNAVILQTLDKMRVWRSNPPPQKTHHEYFALAARNTFEGLCFQRQDGAKKPLDEKESGLALFLLVNLLMFRRREQRQIEIEDLRKMFETLTLGIC